jgi:hypothetical protein
MNRIQKYQLISDMASVGQLTHGHYPGQREFYRALSEGRVSGSYGNQGRIVVSHNDPLKSYTFDGIRIRSQ